MGWMQKLYETYENCAGHEPPGSTPLLPVSHAIQQAHLEVTIDAKGFFRYAKLVDKEETVIPATVKSAGRTGSQPPPHPLCDKIQYCASDYPAFGGEKPSFYEPYEALLAGWCGSEYAHPKALAVHSYVRKGTVVADLVREGLLHVGNDGTLLTDWEGESVAPEIFRMLTPAAGTGKKDQGNAFIRWNVIEEGNPCMAVWEDRSLQDAWIGYEASLDSNMGLCMVTGSVEPLTPSHPKRIRHPGDGAKLISANDGSGYTFRGRFTDDTGQQACGVGKITTQKAHSALRWLIARQGFKNSDQVVVAWAVSGQEIPDPFENTFSLLNNTAPSDVQAEAATGSGMPGDAGQAYALRLRRALSGYSSRLDDPQGIVVMGLDSATPGRMAITFYRELQGSDFLNRIESWHERYAWPQLTFKGVPFIGAPSPKEIADAAYGSRADDKLRKSTVERLLPCIIDQAPVPRDLVVSTFRRACSRQGFARPIDWEQCLGIACALHKGFYNENNYKMTLEQDRPSTAYLYGRLLAVAENIENYALNMSGEKRETTASRYMQRFADRPFSTWKNIELALSPYKARLHSSDKSAGFLKKRMSLIDEIMSMFEHGEFAKESDRPLNGEFLLGYHCQRNEFRPVQNTDTQTQTGEQQ